MLKKHTILKVNTKKASLEGASSCMSISCPYCHHLVTVLRVRENLEARVSCINCHQKFIPKDVVNEKGPRES